MTQAIVASWSGKAIEPGTFVPYLAAMERDAAEAEGDDDEDSVTLRNRSIVEAIAEIQRRKAGASDGASGG